jgi:hypothetical protein
MTIRNKYSLLAITALLICVAVIFFGYQRSHKGKVLLQAVPIQSAYGWGYDIMAGERKYIEQQFIPAVAGKQGFKSSSDALLVGNLVVKKIISNQEPTITLADLRGLGLLKDSANLK